MSFPRRHTSPLARGEEGSASVGISSALLVPASIFRAPGEHLLITGDDMTARLGR